MLKGREKKEKKEDRRYLLLCRYNRSTLGRIVVVLHSDAIPSPSITSLSATPLTLPYTKIKAIATVLECQCRDGGFSGGPGHDRHLLYTLSGLQVLSECNGLDEDTLEVDGLVSFVADLQRPDGSFVGDSFSDDDTRYSYCALSCLALLGELERADLDAAARHIYSCLTPEGAFGMRPGTEAHAGQTFCCLAALALCGKLPTGHTRALVVAWLRARQQIGPGKEGGVNGRPDKREDGCYAWWVGASLAILAGADGAAQEETIDKEKLLKFVTCLQTEDGGLCPRRGEAADVYHTHFGVAALALLGHPATSAVDPVHCMPPATVERLKTFGRARKR